MTTDNDLITMVTLGIFDDDDVLPTVVFGVLYPDEDHLLPELVTMLLEGAEKEYGRPFPAHAQFWSAATKPLPDE